MNGFKNSSNPRAGVLVVMSSRLELIMHLNSQELGKALCHAVEPDNRTSPDGMIVQTTYEKSTLISTIELNGRLQTLLATFNDLITTSIATLNVLENV